MSELIQTLRDLRNFEGVEHVLVLGRDGLLIQHLGDDGLDVETVTAMIPGTTSNASSLGHAAAWGDVSTAVLEFEEGIGIIVTLSHDLLLALLLRSDVGFAPLLRELRHQRGRLAALV